MKEAHRANLTCPVAASRAKLTMLNTVSKIRGQVKNPGYPQSEGLLGECMIRHGKELGGESNFGESYASCRAGGLEDTVGLSMSNACSLLCLQCWAHWANNLPCVGMRNRTDRTVVGYPPKAQCWEGHWEDGPSKF